MAFSPPKGWDKENDKLFIHNTGIRISRMTYRSKEGWFLVPTDLDQPVVEFDPTPEGRDKAFEAFASGVLGKTKTKSKAKPKSKSRKKPKPVEAEAEEKDEDSGDDEDDSDDDEE